MSFVIRYIYSLHYFRQIVNAAVLIDKITLFANVSQFLFCLYLNSSILTASNTLLNLSVGNLLCNLFKNI